MIRICAALAAGLVLVAGNLAQARIADAAPCNRPAYYVHQYTALWYTGLEGRFYTNQPSVPDPTSQHSLSHLYMFRDDFSPFVEVGWYKGFGRERIAARASYYTAREAVGYPYDEKNFEEAPDASIIPYRVANVGLDEVTGKTQWAIYFNDVVNPRWVWRLIRASSTGPGRCLAGKLHKLT